MRPILDRMGHGSSQAEAVQLRTRSVALPEGSAHERRQPAIDRCILTDCSNPMPIQIANIDDPP